MADREHKRKHKMGHQRKEQGTDRGSRQIDRPTQKASTKSTLLRDGRYMQNGLWEKEVDRKSRCTCSLEERTTMSEVAAEILKAVDGQQDGKDQDEDSELCGS